MADILSLPDECLINVFSRLPRSRDWRNVALQCKHWSSLACEARQQLSLAEGYNINGKDLISTLGRLPNLRELVLGAGLFDPLDDSVLCALGRSCPRLEVLTLTSLSRCSQQELQMPTGLNELFLRCVRLRELDLDLRAVSIPIPESLGQLSSLQKLHLACRLDCFDGQALAGLKALKELHLWSFMMFPSLPTFIWSLASLEELTISCESLEGGQWSRISNLRVLDLSCPKPDLEALAALAALSQMRCLKLSCFMLPHGLPLALAHLGSLADLTLSTFYLGSAEERSCLQLFQLKGLKRLALRNFQTMDAQIFQGLKGLARLEVSNYRDTVLPSIKDLTNLQKLSVVRCTKIVTLPGSIRYATNLRELELDGLYQISSLPPLANLISLENVFIRKCDLLNMDAVDVSNAVITRL